MSEQIVLDNTSLRVLRVSWNAQGSDRLDLDGELRQIREGLNQSAARGHVRIEAATDIPVGQIGRELDAFNPQILHISSYGWQGLLVGRSDDLAVVTLPHDAVVTPVAHRRGATSLVVLSACTSASLGRRLLEAGVAAVVSTTGTIPNPVMITFACTFYRALGDGWSVREAFERGVAEAGALKDADEEVKKLRLLEREGAASFLRFELERPPPPSVRRALLWVDLDARQPTQDAIESLMFPSRRAETITLTGHGATKLQRDTQGAVTGWYGIREALDKALHTLDELPREGEPMAVYVAGNAPMPVFALIGLRLGPWCDPVYAAHTPHDYPLQRLPMAAAAREGVPFFDRLEGLERPVAAKGPVAVYVSLAGDPFPPALAAYMDSYFPGTLAGVVTLSTNARKALSASNIGQVLRELRKHLQDLRGCYGGITGLVVAVNGAWPLALAVGRAINHKQFGFIDLPNFEKGTYSAALRWGGESPWSPPGVPADAEARLARQHTLEALRDAVESFRGEAALEELTVPAGLLLEAKEREAVLGELRSNLKGLRIDRKPGEGGFLLSVDRGELRFGEGLLEGMRGVGEDVLRVAGPLFVLHELYHVAQRLGGAGYRGIGRAGFVLEEVDFWADAFALVNVSLHSVREGGRSAERNPAPLAAAAIDAHIAAMGAFDRMEQGPRMARLPERRLRRYLIWHLQRARALTLRSPQGLESLYAGRLLVELAPLDGSIDAGGDKIVERATPNTQLFAALSGRLIRRPRLPDNFEPAQLVEAVRRFDRAVLERAMGYLVEAERELLLPRG